MVERLADVIDIEPDDPIQTWIAFCGLTESKRYLGAVLASDRNSQYAARKLHNDRDCLAAVVVQDSGHLIIAFDLYLKVPDSVIAKVFHLHYAYLQFTWRYEWRSLDLAALTGIESF